MRSKRRFKHTRHTLYRFDDELSEYQLHVVLIRAELAALLGRTGRRARFFVRARLGDRTVESLVVKRSSSPRWHARFVFGLEQTVIARLQKTRDEMLHVSIFHQSTLGRTEIPLANVLSPVSKNMERIVR